MSGLLAMGTPPTTNDVGRYYFWLSHNWQFLVPRHLLFARYWLGWWCISLRVRPALRPGLRNSRKRPLRRWIWPNRNGPRRVSWHWR